MYSIKYFVTVGAVLVFILATDNGVSAAPHPCLWMLDYDRTHPEPTTPTPKPELVEEFAKLKQKKTNQLKELADWIIWGPSNESQKPRSRNPVEKIISSYVKFLEKIISMF